MTHIAGEVYIAALLGIGDAIVLKPLIQILSSQYSKIYWPATPSNFVTVRSLFSDLSNVTVVERPNQEWELNWLTQKQIPVLDFRKIIQETTISYLNFDFSVTAAPHYDRQIYEYFDVRFSLRYSAWTAPFDSERGQQLFDQVNPNHEPYLLWHNSTSYRPQGADIDLAQWRAAQGWQDLKIISVEPVTDNLLDWHLLISQAEEIHCVSSSFHCLVDSLHKKTAADLYYHDVRHNAILQVNSNHNSHRWKVVNYDYRI